LTKRCPSCGNLATDDARFCNICGTGLELEHRTDELEHRTEPTGTAEITPEDAQEIVEEVRRVYSSIPLLARPMVPPMPEILKRIPACARKYTLQQIIDLLEEAHAQGLL